jgi:hypothetical protein
VTLAMGLLPGLGDEASHATAYPLKPAAVRSRTRSPLARPSDFCSRWVR